MAILQIIKGPDKSRQFTIRPRETVIGRHGGSDICLESQAVSRQHARILHNDGDFFIEDLDSSNGTLVNGQAIRRRVPLTEQDRVQIGPYLFAFRLNPPEEGVDDDVVIRDQVTVNLSNKSLHGQNAAQKLQVVLEIAQHLARTLDLDTLLDKLLAQLLQLFLAADRGMVLLAEGERLAVRAQRYRNEDDAANRHPYSRTVIRKALDDGIGIFSEDISRDQRFKASDTLLALNVRSLLCVPLLAPDGRRLGVIQLDHYRGGRSLQPEDLPLLTVVAFQVTATLENASMHAELLREERLRQELMLAREIQEGFLPTRFPTPEADGFDLYAHLWPAREVAGDLYDFFPRPDGSWAFFVGDVSGKGVPAALFMVAVRTLGRHLSTNESSAARTLSKLNASVAANNPAGMFVTLAHGIYQPTSGEVLLASGGHPRPFLRRKTGAVETIPLSTGRLLGYEGGDLRLSDTRLTLQPGETLIFYTDGLTEAVRLDGKTMFGEQQLAEKLAATTSLELTACAHEIRAAVLGFTGRDELTDDATLLLLRRG